MLNGNGHGRKRTRGGGGGLEMRVLQSPLKSCVGALFNLHPYSHIPFQFYGAMKDKWEIT